MRVRDVGAAAGAAGDDVVHLEDAEGELAAATGAAVLLLAAQDMLVLAVRLGLSVYTTRLQKAARVSCGEWMHRS